MIDRRTVLGGAALGTASPFPPLIDREQRIDIALVADNPGKWLLHCCQMLEHAVAGMSTWFEVS